MKSLIICLSLLSAATLKAEDPVMLGLRGALNAMASIPEETSYKVRSTAAELLARYVKLRDGSFLSERASGGTRMWMEMKGLQITRVTGAAVSEADKANGTHDRYLVSVDCEMYRTYDKAAAKWSQWYNGRNPFMPPIIYVERTTAGQWIARSSALSSLIAQSPHGDPKTIPHGPQPAPKPQSITTAAPRIMSPSKSTASSKDPVPPNHFIADLMKALFRQGVAFAFLLVVLVAICGTLMKILFGKPLGKRTGKHGGRSRSRRTTPPLLRSGSAGSQPPPLPATSAAGEINLIHLIERKETLMTAAEQAFFDVLEPLVRSSCRVSSNVRLLDLFEVRREPGQQSALNKIRSKHIDFVLTENGTSRILCAIELDDSSHKRSDRIERDVFVNELFATLGLPLLRVPFAWAYNMPELRAKLLNAGISLPNAA